MDRRTFIKATGLAGAVGLAGCTGGPSGDGGTETTGSSGEGGESETQQTTGASEPEAHVGVVYATGGLGDGSFNDQAQQGIQQAADEYGVAYNEAQPDEVSQFQNFQQQFASSTNPNYDLVACIGYLQADSLSQTAQSYPDQEFMIVDSTVDADNVASYVFKEHQGSFLAGQMAGLLTTQEFSAGDGQTNPDQKTVGFVGGVEGGLIAKFEAGFKAGVKNADDSVEVQSTYVGSFNDPSAGKEAALSMYNSGADIVYHAAGNTGTGVFQAAKEQGAFAIGVDRDQSLTKPSFAGVILGSMVKRVDTAVYNAVESVVNGEFEGGSTVTLGLEQDGVALVYGDSLGSEIPSDVKDSVSSVREEIISGSISVPTDPSEV
ncbi:BMP family lipoprotein [Halopelagius longus]|uniref:BMP family ABC transporter substrate-binding protein n=1 Tax=Halopelagius longus TaxID=1236180 RepID=A0A1H1AYP9_9EURY|nr:BMP family protein [Halopelagius longus]RDI70567.1 BMP family ABC transporter substrate-binding protein [Halopelagius longus]SDQ44789.1 nucleoside-binding protein [Halopelagius longus]